MPSFSKSSKEKLNQCDERLQKVFNEVIKHFDCSIICGHRNEEEQNEAFRTGRSKLKFPQSKHNSKPSTAIDAVPYPIDWNDIDRFHYFAGHVVGIAKTMGINLKYGGDWDKDTQLKDNNFNDLPHYEIVD